MAITSGLTVNRLSAEEERRYGFTHRVTVPSSVLATVGAGNTTATIALLDVAIGDVVGKAAYVCTTAFDASDAAINSLTVKIGDGSDDDRFMTTTGTQLAADGTTVLNFHAPYLSTAPYAYGAADTVDALFTVAGGASPTMTELNAGSVQIFLQVYPLSAID